uniref:UBX domain-containing protein 7 n=1 Tax=Anthurium amnicola TaxID=1678845 RepID=A0A1D1YZD4_9ARAE
MESVLNPSEKDNLVSSFLEIAAGQTVDTAMQFLQATSWRLEEALQLFYVGNEGGGAGLSAATASPGYNFGAGDRVVASENLGDQAVGDDGVRPPLPVKREVLYDDALLFYSDDSLHASSMAFRNFNEEAKHPDVWESDQSAPASSANGSQDNLASLYRPPFALMYQGSFDKAKFEASHKDKWLLVNLQSTDEFSSHMLNRDTWSNEAVAQTIRTNFIFWQVYHDSSEGKKVCNYYNLINIPAILIIDPVTGQKMQVWNGMVHPDRLLEDLLPFMDRGPQEHHVVLPHKRPRDTDQSSKHVSADKTPEEDSGEVLQAAAAASIEDNKDVVGSSATGGEQPEPDKEVAVGSSDVKPTYPPLPEEPKGNREILCKVGIRLPDGRRIQRNFLRTDPIQLLWSFCSSQLGEEEKRSFRFTQAIPGASMSVEYGSKLTFSDSGLSNSMISLTWE